MVSQGLWIAIAVVAILVIPSHLSSERCSTAAGRSACAPPETSEIEAHKGRPVGGYPPDPASRSQNRQRRSPPSRRGLRRSTPPDSPAWVTMRPSKGTRWETADLAGQPPEPGTDRGVQESAEVDVGPARRWSRRSALGSSRRRRRPPTWSPSRPRPGRLERLRGRLAKCRAPSGAACSACSAAAISMRTPGGGRGHLLVGRPGPDDHHERHRASPIGHGLGQRAQRSPGAGRAAAGP